MNYFTESISSLLANPVGLIHGFVIISLLLAGVTFHFMRKKRKKLKPIIEPPGETAVEKFVSLLKEIHFASLWPYFRKSMKRQRRRLWNFVVDAFLVPKYRDEWGKYKYWDFQNPQRPRRRRKVEKAKSRLYFKSLRDALEEEHKLHHALKLPIFSSTRLEVDETPQVEPVPHDHTKCERIVINVSGLKFDTQIRTLSRFPNTLLGNPHKRARLFNPETNEYFLDRHRPSFEAVMYYYQSGGVLRCPNNIHVDVFFEELDFYELGDETIDKLKETEGLAADEEKEMPSHLLKRKLWLLIEYPESSTQAKVVAIFSIFVIVISIYAFCMETTPEFSKEGEHQVFSTEGGNGDEEDEEEAIERLDIYDPMYYLETICISWFVFEFVTRAILCPNHYVFFSDIMNIIDLVAILPYFFGLISHFIGQYEAMKRAQALAARIASGAPKPKSRGKASSLSVFRVIRLVRVFRIFKLSRHSKGLKVLGKTLKASLRELGMLVFFLIICIVLFSSAIFFAEQSIPDTKFVSIPASFWFSVVTMTTVGFGDEVPTGVLGKIVGGLCAVTGVLTISLPVPVIVSNFNSFYQRESYVGQLEQGQDSDDGTGWRINYLDQCPDRSGKAKILKKKKRVKLLARRHYLEEQFLDSRRSLLCETESDEEFEILKYKNKKQFDKMKKSKTKNVSQFYKFS